MTILQMEQKMNNIHNRMYKEIAKGNYEKAYKLQAQYVDLCVKAMKSLFSLSCRTVSALIQR